MKVKNGTPGLFVGDILCSKKLDNFEVVEYINAHKIRLKSYETGNDQIWTNVAQAKKGNIFDPLKRTVSGVGYLGIGPYKSKHNRVSDEAYNRWKNMLARCYDEQIRAKQPAYNDCTVHPDWHNFQTYAEWFYNNPYYKKGWNVDKDLLVFGNRQYGPDTCVLLPAEINSAMQMRVSKEDGLPNGVKMNSSCPHLFEASSSLFNKKTYLGLYSSVDEAANAYKSFREDHIKDLVSRYLGQIDPTVYEKLMNFKVEDYGR